MSAGNTIRTVREMVSRGVTKKEDHSLSCLVEYSIRLLRGSLSIEPVVTISADADCVYVNKVQIEQVLVNLYAMRAKHYRVVRTRDSRLKQRV